MIASISLSMVPTLNYRMEQPGGSVRNVLAGILKRNLYEIVHTRCFCVCDICAPQAVDTVDIRISEIMDEVFLFEILVRNRNM